MSPFESSLQSTGSPPPFDNVRAVIALVMRPGNFFVSPKLRFIWKHGDEETAWELFRGRVLDHTQTRQRQTFETWSIAEADASSESEPLLAVRLDAPSGCVFVTRSIRCRTWEGYFENGQALSRESIRRVRELVGTIDPANTTAAELHDELTILLALAVVGTSRLPLTSLEAPLPEFTFGQFAYHYRPNATDEPVTSAETWLQTMTTIGAAQPASRAFEFALRATPREKIAALGANVPAGASNPEVFRALFNNIALSPYTDFVTKTLALIQELVHRGAMTIRDEIDLLAHVLRQVCRHLTSFDLVVFHHRGANYPDALLLDELAIRVWELAEQHPDEFLAGAGDQSGTVTTKRLRRRAMRQAWLLRRQYRGLPVPDVPTSPGENARLLPESTAQAPDEQILNLNARTRQLFTDCQRLDQPSAIVLDILTQSIADLAEPAEALELGMGLFLDRPLGFAKTRGEPDATLLLSHEAFSRSIAESRRKLLSEFAADLPPLNFVATIGVRWFSKEARQRPGVVSAHDAQVTGNEFVFLRTTRTAVREFLRQYAVSAPCLDWLRSERCLILPSTDEADILQIFDERWRLRARLRMDASAGYTSRAGIDYLVGGLDLLAAWDERGELIANETACHIRPMDRAGIEAFRTEGARQDREVPQPEKLS